MVLMDQGAKLGWPKLTGKRGVGRRLLWWVVCLSSTSPVQAKEDRRPPGRARQGNRRPPDDEEKKTTIHPGKTLANGRQGRGQLYRPAAGLSPRTSCYFSSARRTDVCPPRHVDGARLHADRQPAGRVMPRRPHHRTVEKEGIVGTDSLGPHSQQTNNTIVAAAGRRTVDL